MQYFKDTNPKLPWKSCDCFTRQVCTEHHRLGTRCTAVNSACNPTCLELTVWKNKAEEKQVYKEKVKGANTMGKKWSLGEMFVVIWNELKSGSFQASGGKKAHQSKHHFAFLQDGYMLYHQTRTLIQDHAKQEDARTKARGFPRKKVSYGKWG